MGLGTGGRSGDGDLSPWGGGVARLLAPPSSPQLLQTSHISAHFRTPLTAQPPSLQPGRTSRTETGRKIPPAALQRAGGAARNGEAARQEEGNVFKNQANAKVPCQNVALHLGLPPFGCTWPNYATVAAPVHKSSSSRYTESLRGFRS